MIDKNLVVGGRLFHRKAPEKDVLVLNMFIFGLGKTKLIVPRVGTA